MLSSDDIQSIQGCVDDLEYVLQNWEYFASCNPNEHLYLDEGDTALGMFAVS